jgi:hypothetical protein
VLLGIGAARAWGRWPRLTGGLLVLLVLLGSLRTFTYARLWNDRLVFYDASLRDQPRSVQLYLLLSTEYRERGDGESSARVMAEARRLVPDYWLVYNYSALAELARGDFDAAEAYATRSMALHPDLEAVGIQQRIDKARAATRPAGTRPTATQPAR